MPSIKCCAKNLIQSAVIIVKGKFVKKQPTLVAIAVRDKRLAICRSNECGQFDNGIRCKNCGCVMKVKSFLTTMDCPLDKWKDL